MNWRKLRCLFNGHDVVATGRHALILHELQCRYCGGLYVWNAHYDRRVILPVDHELDRLFRDVAQIQLSASAEQPTNTTAGTDAPASPKDT